MVMIKSFEELSLMVVCVRMLKRNVALCETGRSESLDTKTRIQIPEDRYGLYAIDVLDPDMVRVAL